jgi:hypothetical protein
MASNSFAFIIRLCQVLTPALEAMIASHLESGAPLVVEGDFLLPALAVQPAYQGMAAGGQVRAIFLYEDEEAQLRRNFATRAGVPVPAFPATPARSTVTNPPIVCRRGERVSGRHFQTAEGEPAARRRRPSTAPAAGGRRQCARHRGRREPL